MVLWKVASGVPRLAAAYANPVLYGNVSLKFNDACVQFTSNCLISLF